MQNYGYARRSGVVKWLFQSRGDIHAVAHKIAVALLDDVAQMNADPELDAALGRHASVALDEPFGTSMAQRTASTTLRSGVVEVTAFADA